MLTRMGENGRGRRTVVRALFGYLILAWLLIRMAPDDSGLELVALALLLGFPLVISVARILHHYGPAAMADGWLIALAAGAAAIAVPVACLQIHASAGPEATTLEDSVYEVLPAALVSGTEITASEDERLRLRIRGLTLLPTLGAEAADRDAMLLLDTSVRDGSVGKELVILVQLIGVGGGEVFWRREYLADPTDMPAVRQLLVQALGEAMSRTREGVGEGRLI